MKMASRLNFLRTNINHSEWSSCQAGNDCESSAVCDSMWFTEKDKKKLIFDSLGASVIEEAVKTCLHNITAKTSTCLKKRTVATSIDSDLTLADHVRSFISFPGSWFLSPRDEKVMNDRLRVYEYVSCPKLLKKDPWTLGRLP